MRELGGGGRRVFADEGDAQQLARQRVMLAGGDGLVAEQAEGHAVDFLHHMRKNRRDPGVAEVEEPQRVVAAVARDRRLGLRRCARALEDVVEELVGLGAGEAFVGEEDEQPLGEERLQLARVQLSVEHHQVRRALHRVPLPPFVQHLLDILEHCARRKAVGVVVGSAASLAEEKRVEQMQDHAPAHASAGARGVGLILLAGGRHGEGERMAEAEGPVELRLEGVQDHVDLIEQQRALLEHLHDLGEDLDLRAV
mmetsp:Transcript_59342/g.139760  ORF Transcript_59342/g.139760 Transcript_59342/m.139760 type:complete len:254 (+) Transcript_59342:4641-5402(+)